MNEKLLTAREVSVLLSITTTTLANWRFLEKYQKPNRSKIPLKWVILPSGSVRYKESDVLEWMKQTT